MKRRSRSSETRSRRKSKLLARLHPEEAVRVLESILERHPELAVEAETIAATLVADVDVEALAQDVEQAVLDLDFEDLGARSGRHSWGYVEPSEAAWELLGEALEPFLAELKRCIELGFETPAIATCAGIVLGLYRCEGKGSDRVLGYAEDFPAETAAHTVESFTRATAKRRGAWRIPAAVISQVPEWAEMISRYSRPPRTRRGR